MSDINPNRQRPCLMYPLQHGFLDGNGDTHDIAHALDIQMSGEEEPICNVANVHVPHTVECAAAAPLVISGDVNANNTVDSENETQRPAIADISYNLASTGRVICDAIFPAKLEADEIVAAASEDETAKPENDDDVNDANTAEIAESQVELVSNSQQAEGLMISNECANGDTASKQLTELQGIDLAAAADDDEEENNTATVAETPTDAFTAESAERFSELSENELSLRAYIERSRLRRQQGNMTNVTFPVDHDSDLSDDDNAYIALSQQQQQSNNGIRNNATNEDESRMCWICLETEAERPTASWLHPCRCRGTQKWVHLRCINHYVEYQTISAPAYRVRCPQCRTLYILAPRRENRLGRLFIFIGEKYCIITPFVLKGIYAAAVYWLAVTIGAFTFAQYHGIQATYDLIVNGNLAISLICFPLVPLTLSCINYLELDRLLFSLLGISPAENYEDVNYYGYYDRNSDYDLIDVRSLSHVRNLFDVFHDTYNFFIAMLMPTIAIIFGLAIFSSIDDFYYRSLYGGLTYIGIKTIIKFFMRLCNAFGENEQVILRYDE